MATVRQTPRAPTGAILAVALAAFAVAAAWWLLATQTQGSRNESQQMMAQPGTSGSREGQAASPIAVEHAWVRASTQAVGTSAAYMELHNPSRADDRLLGVSTSAAGKVGVHSTSMQDGVVRMQPAGPLVVPAGGEVQMASGGLHVMLMDLRADLSEGSQVDLVLHFERAGDVSVSAPVRSAATGGMEPRR